MITLIKFFTFTGNQRIEEVDCICKDFEGAFHNSIRLVRIVGFLRK